MPQRTAEVLDIPLRFRDGALNGDDVLHAGGLGQQRLQTLQLDAGRLQPGLRVVIAFRHIIRAGGLIGHMAQLACLPEKRLKLRRRNADSIAGAAIAVAAVGYAALLEIPAQLLHQRVHVAAGLVKVQRLHLHVAGINHLDGFGVLCAAGSTVRFLHQHVIPLRFGCFVCVTAVHVPVAAVILRRGVRTGIFCGAAAADQCQSQYQRQQERSDAFHRQKPPSFWDLPVYVTMTERKRFPDM